MMCVPVLFIQPLEDDLLNVATDGQWLHETAESLQKEPVTGIERRRFSGDPPSLARKPQSRAEALGQVFTSQEIAERMVRGINLHLATPDVAVLDPCVGPYTFPKAIERLRSINFRMDVLDLDHEMCEISVAHAEKWPSRVSVLCTDYLLHDCKEQYDYAILNPPYVRQEWIADKARYRSFLSRYLGNTPSGTANLYVYFIAKVIADLRAGGRMACIVYDSWQSTMYGRWLTGYLNERCSTWTCEPAPAQTFKGRLIDATIIYAEKAKTSNSISESASLQDRHAPGFAPIASLFGTRRGLRLKQTDFFMTSLDRVVDDGATPFVKKVSKIPGFAVPRDHPEAALLISSSEGNNDTRHALSKRLSNALQQPENNVSILTWYREREEIWNLHNNAPKDAILFNYYLRRRPRHILNSDMRAYSDNFYGLTPRGRGSPVEWLALLNSTSTAIAILKKSRNQGSGLAKIQLYEYRDCSIVDIREWSAVDRGRLHDLGNRLTSDRHPDEAIANIDSLIASVMGTSELHPSNLLSALADVDNAAKRPESRSR